MVLRELAMHGQLECLGGPLDGQIIRLRPGQNEILVPYSTTRTAGPRRFAVYSVRRTRRLARSGQIARPVYVLFFRGEEFHDV